MAAGEGQASWRMPISAVVKAAPTRVRLGLINTPMPAAYANSVGLLVTIRQTGWRSLDNREFRVSAWQDGDAASFPDLILEDSDTTGETAAQPPNLANAIIEIRPSIANVHRFPPEI